MTRKLMQLLILAMTLLAGAPAAFAQAWPAAKPVRIVIAFGPGSASDIFARMVADQLGKSLGQSVIVEARPGAAGQIAAELVAGAPADGYTLFLTTNTTHSANPYLFKNLRYHPIRDFTPIIRIGYFPFALLVNSTLPVRNVPELVAYAKAHPTAANYAYSSSAGQIAAAALSNSTGMKAVGVAYKSAPEVITSVIGGQVMFTVLDFATTQGIVQSGRLRALAVTPQERSTLAPHLPTIAEETGLKEFGVVAWMGIFGPASLPAPITDRLYRELRKILDTDDAKARIAAMGAEPAVADPAVFDAFVKSQLAVWERQIRIAGMQAE
jgi:tripartite-type tricarboxylate transporter receptor subunit TctC